MQELSPLTISNSIRKNPTILITDKRERYLLYEPIRGVNNINSELYCFVIEHFKIDHFKKGFFKLKGTKYLCSEEIEGCLLLSEWLSFQWESKRGFNRFIRPRALFDMFLADLFFPFFMPSKKWIVPGSKDRFVVNPFPKMKDSGVAFEPIDIGKTGMTDPSLKSFFRHMKGDLSMYLEEFLELHHDKFRSDLKYRVSLYPDQRNEYWEAFQQSFDPSFRKYVKAEVENYILQL